MRQLQTKLILGLRMQAKPKAPGDALDEEETEPQTNGAPPPPVRRWRMGFVSLN